MTPEHPSHYGVNKRTENELYIFFTGSLAGCLRFAYAHGLEKQTHFHPNDVKRERITFRSLHGKGNPTWITRASGNAGPYELVMGRYTYENS